MNSMKAAGIIAEYNPFHKGHEYHIAETRRITGADYCVVVMSGDFVQRGEPAILDKYTRTEMALACGADLVLELPAAFAAASAEKFAYGAVSLLHSLGVIDTISCGCELDSDMIHTVSSVLAEEPACYRFSLKQQLKAGASFPAAREAALLSYFQEHPEAFQGTDLENAAPNDRLSLLHELISSPNAILALEYGKAIRKLHSPVTLQLIRRRGRYHAEELPDQHDLSFFESGGVSTNIPDSVLPPEYASATAIRRFLFQHQQSLSELQSNEDAIRSLPEQVISLLSRSSELMEKNDFSPMLGYALLAHRNGDLAKYQDITPELANRILNQITYYQDWDSFSELIKTRQITKTHVDRALLHLLLEIPKEKTGLSDAPLYARVLGFQSSAAPVLKEIKRRSTIPLLTKMADAEKTLQNWYTNHASPCSVQDALTQLQQDIFAADLYETARAGKYSVQKRNEYRQEIKKM